MNPDPIPDNSTKKSIAPSLILSAIAVGFGFVIRLVQYLSNRSLWGNEASIALSIYQLSPKNYKIGQWDIKKTGRKKLDRDNLQGLKSEINQLQGKRVWFILSDTSEEETIFAYLDRVSNSISCFQKPGAVTCLYKLPTL